VGTPLMAVPRLVLDTNTVLSALLFTQGRLAWLRFAWQGHRLIPLVSRDTTGELMRVLAYSKFKLTPAEREELLGDYLPYCEVVTLSPARPDVSDCRDPADRPFLELALAAKADALISGDADLQVLAGVFPLPIVAPGDVASRFPALSGISRTDQ
jgi:putative PIN family toxin of toxin-antitoxin system